MLQLPRHLRLRHSALGKFRGLSHREGARRHEGTPAPTMLTAPSQEEPLDGKLLETAERVIGFLKPTSPGIVGVMGLHAHGGSTRLVRALAQAYKILDRRVLIVSAVGASAPPAVARIINGHAETIDVHARISHVGALPMLDLAHHPDLAASKDRFDATCDQLRETYDLILIDLPVAATTLAEVATVARIVGQACEAVLCVCLTEMATHADLAAKMQLCRLLGIRLAGLIVNDQGWSLAKILHR